MSAVAEVVKMPPQPFSIERACEIAMEKGAVDELAKLLDLKLKYQAHEARLAYVTALQAFKADPPDIEKTKKVSYGTGANAVSYHHAELDVVNEIIQPALKKHGLCLTWRPSDSAGRITVTAVLTHELGHSEDIATVSGPSDTSGGKNNVQAIGSTLTYLERYTAFAGLGLVPKGKDDDGKSGEGMSEDAITDYSIQMQDAPNYPELKEVFRECYEKAKKLNDNNAKQRLTKVYETRKRELA